MTVTRYPGRPFFMMTGIALASRAPASMNRASACADHFAAHVVHVRLKEIHRVLRQSPLPVVSTTIARSTFGECGGSRLPAP